MLLINLFAPFLKIYFELEYQMLHQPPQCGVHSVACEEAVTKLRISTDRNAVQLSVWN